MKLCKNCNNFKPSIAGGFCESPRNGTSLVDGKSIVRFAETNRRNSETQPRCGPEASWFQTKVRRWWQIFR